MKNLWEKIKNFFSRIWNGLTYIGRILLGLVLVALVILIVWVSADKADDNSNTEETASRPEIAQVFEPSIGTPLPADNPTANTDTGSVNGAVTETPAAPSPTPTPTPQFVAPIAGINDTDPIHYTNPDLKFAVTLPAHTQVAEKSDEVMFTSGTRILLYKVSITASGNETLDSIEQQLRNSPSATAISRTVFANNQAIIFSAKGYGTGIAFIANGNIYYILGNKQYIVDFKTL